MQKLYVIVRADLKPGAQLAQSGHAIAAFGRRFREAFEAWTDGPNNLVVLAIADEPALALLFERLTAAGGQALTVHEPDLGDQLTAVAFACAPATSRLVSSLPLALRQLAAAA